MKKKIVLIIMLVLTPTIMMESCSQAERVSSNVSQEADSFNVTRRLCVLNSRTDKPAFELIGNFSIKVDESDHQLEVVCQTGHSEFKKHIIGLNAETMYVIEDIGGAEVDKYKYEVNYLPEMIQPIKIVSND